MQSLFAGRYVIKKRLGSGGMGSVFEAYDTVLDKAVAIKTINTGAFQAETVIRFQREACALAALSHQNLVPIYLFGVTDNNEPYLVMHLETGTSLSELIDLKQLHPLNAIKIFRQICSALQHAHEKGVLHRDLKPSNIIVKDVCTDSPVATVVDFGIAMIDSASTVDTLTKTGALLGTPAYMSPEQSKGLKLDSRTDIYSLGCIMFETFTGKKPFVANSSLEVLRLKVSCSAPSINAVQNERLFSPGIEAVVAKCLSLERDNRFSSMSEIELELDKINDAEDVILPAQESGTKCKQTKADIKRLVKYAVVTGCVCLCIAAITVIQLWEPVPLVNVRGHDFEITKNSVDFGLDKKYPTWTERYQSSTRSLQLPRDATDTTAMDMVRRQIERGKLIESIEVRDSEITGEFLQNCQRLPILRLSIKSSGVNTSGLKAISQLPKLHWLSIANVDEGCIKADGVACLAQARSLRDLGLVKCYLDKSAVDKVSLLSQLEQLDLSKNADVDDDCLGQISRMTSLTSLQVNYTHITGGGLKEHILKLKNLRNLSIEGLEVGDEDIGVFEKMSLSSLNIQGTKITEHGWKRLSRIKTLIQLFPSSPEQIPNTEN